jgi:hypothetical protein
MGEEERKVVFSVVFDKLIEAKREGKPFMGAMFWNAALHGEGPLIYASRRNKDMKKIYGKSSWRV